MSSSFIEYRGHGFWSFDPFIEFLAGEVAEAIERQATKESWETDLVAHWKLQASGIFGGWVHLRLDEFLTGEERKRRIRAAVQSVAGRHRAEDDPIGLTGALLLRLLDGKLTTDAASPKDYMVDGRLHRPQDTNE